MAKNKKQNNVSKQRLREQIEEDTRVFLKRGGKIQEIPSGQSGQELNKPGPKHVRLGNSK